MKSHSSSVIAVPTVPVDGGRALGLAGEDVGRERLEPQRARGDEERAGDEGVARHIAVGLQALTTRMATGPPAADRGRTASERAARPMGPIHDRGEVAEACAVRRPRSGGRMPQAAAWQTRSARTAPRPAWSGVRSERSRGMKGRRASTGPRPGGRGRLTDTLVNRLTKGDELQRGHGPEAVVGTVSEA
jgi:hypothetical protein